MSFVVVYDANVLYPASLRDLLVRLAMRGVVRARWSERILDEVFNNILADRPELDASRLQRTRELMNAAVRDVVVTGFEDLIDGLTLPDVDDRHVLACAIRCGAQAIVTTNTRDFPASSLDPYGIEALHPDEFVLHTLDLHPASVVEVVNEQVAALTTPPMTRDELLSRFATVGLPRAVARIRDLLS